MSLMAYAGREHNLLEPGPEHCALLKLQHPFLSREDMARIRASRRSQVQACTLDMLVDLERHPHCTGQDLEDTLDDLFRQAEQALAEGATLLILSDAGADALHVPLPSLLAVSGLHHHLLRRGLRAFARRPRRFCCFARLRGGGAPFRRGLGRVLSARRALAKVFGFPRPAAKSNARAWYRTATVRHKA